MKHNSEGERNKRTSRVSIPLLERIQPDAAGIDCGQNNHFVAVPPERDQQPVPEFRTFTADLKRLGDWLVQCGVKTVGAAHLPQPISCRREALVIEFYQLLADAAVHGHHPGCSHGFGSNLVTGCEHQEETNLCAGSAVLIYYQVHPSECAPRIST